MNIRTHNEEMVRLLQAVLSAPNARTAAQNKLYNLRATLLVKTKRK